MRQFIGKCVGGPLAGQWLAWTSNVKGYSHFDGTRLRELGRYRHDDLSRWLWEPSDAARELGLTVPVVSLCPGCGQNVTTYWRADDTGCESRPEYVLIAASAWHSLCWETAVKTYQPNTK